MNKRKITPALLVGMCMLSATNDSREDGIVLHGLSAEVLNVGDLGGLFTEENRKKIIEGLTNLGVREASVLLSDGQLVVTTSSGEVFNLAKMDKIANYRIYTLETLHRDGISVHEFAEYCRWYKKCPVLADSYQLILELLKEMGCKNLLSIPKARQNLSISLKDKSKLQDYTNMHVSILEALKANLNDTDPEFARNMASYLSNIILGLDPSQKTKVFELVVLRTKKQEVKQGRIRPGEELLYDKRLDDNIQAVKDIIDSIIARLQKDLAEYQRQNESVETSSNASSDFLE